MATFVLVHGASGGGWIWRETANRLCADGHEVYTPTLTGLGERTHLASPQLGLETYLQDIGSVLAFERLQEVILVGHSFGGMVVTGVAARMPERIAQLVYLDAYLPEPGQSVASMLPPQFIDAMQQVVDQFDGYRLPPQSPLDDRLMPMLVKPCFDPLVYEPAEAFLRIKRAFIYCTADKHQPDPSLLPVIAAAARVRSDPNWLYLEAPNGHVLMQEDPALTAELLRKVLLPVPQ